MKKVAFWAIFFGLNSLFLSVGVFSQEHSFIFRDCMPGKTPEFLAKPGVIRGETKELEISIEIPGLEKINKMKLLYVEYSGELPEKWTGMTILWHKTGAYWPIYAYIGIKEGSNFGDIYYQAYRVGFLASLKLARVDLAKIKNDYEETYLYFGGEKWAFTELEDAVAQVGLIRGAKIVGKQEIIDESFRKILEIPEGCFDRKRLARIFFILADKNSDKYLENLGVLVSAFVKIAPKLDEQNPKKINFDNKIRLVAIK